ncbi:glycoside hydrolase 15 protein [Dinochytrium kinnereticum]|nr:glycoside hydrolase 15 protein [Dinochytrium kinnereticum]
MRASAFFAAFMAVIAFAVANPVELQRREAVVTTVNPNVPTSGNVVLQSFSFDEVNGQFSGSIWVKNIAFSKTVQVFYSTPLSTWISTGVNAVYSAPATNGYEIWTFSATPAGLGPNSQFYLKYGVSGTFYYDNNATRNYKIPAGAVTTTQPPVSTSTTPVTTTTTTPIQPPAPSVTVIAPNPPTTQVQLREYSFSGGVLSGRIWVQNLAFNKAVNVIASTTTGVWGAGASATYSAPGANGYEIWAFSASIPGTGTGSQFYIKYDVNGQTFYDSNGGPGRNYPIVGTISPPAETGFASDITSWFSAALPSLKNYLFKNISPPGAITGVVVAAPRIQTTTSQNYFFHWIRDASLVMDLVNNLYIEGDNTLESKLFDYQTLTKRLQLLPALTGLGQAKFNPDGTDFKDPWCRPQNDGPGLRASVFMRFAKAYLAKGGDRNRIIAMYNSTASGVIKADLDYTVNNSYDTNGCDLWEETRGLHFFTQMMSRRALKEGVEFANFLGDSASAARYAGAAAGLDEYVKRYWNPSVNTVMTTLGARQLDAAIALTVNHGYNFDGVYSPADDKILNSLYQLALGFIPEYSLNTRTTKDNLGRPLSVAIGRYYGDTYNGINSGNLGNPWYLCTNAVAETYYRAAIEYIKAGSITVTGLNRNFFVGDRPAGVQAGNIAVGTYAKGSPEFNAIIGGLQSLADTYVRRARFHGDVDYRFGEQYLRTDGTANGQGVRDLTWSYSSFLTAFEAREQLKKLLA